MAGKMKWNNALFTKLGHSPKVTAVLQRHLDSIAARAKADAPVDTGDYRDRITTRIKSTATRNVGLVVAEDPASMFVESETGNLARALNAEKTGG
ncbi:hypothetical protein [Pseudarthrobacter cellobiosi]|uniref:hypothetical protein n=1 Tax=Pseudarthrobacter cellobiosi TaxID=2953654 RepID=UPI00208DDDFD|nr:hypothetical protein [Pseudarthrobacter sp. HLT1-5]